MASKCTGGIGFEAVAKLKPARFDAACGLRSMH